MNQETFNRMLKQAFYDGFFTIEIEKEYGSWDGPTVTVALVCDMERMASDSFVIPVK